MLHLYLLENSDDSSLIVEDDRILRSDLYSSLLLERDSLSHQRESLERAHNLLKIELSVHSDSLLCSQTVNSNLNDLLHSEKSAVNDLRKRCRQKEDENDLLKCIHRDLSHELHLLQERFHR